MALQKAREFTYRPPARRRAQIAGAEREKIRIPRAGNGKTGNASLIRVVLMLGAVIGLAIILSSFR